MLVKNFRDFDIQYATKLSHLVWGDFYKSENPDVQGLIYDYTFMFYDLNRNFSYGVFDSDEKFKGFLLAFKKNDTNDSINLLNNTVKTLREKDKRKTLLELNEFLENCGVETKQNMNDDDIMIGLFVSTVKGCGKLLLSRLIEDCQKNKIKNIYLWSDTTCDYDYYQKNNFEIVNQQDIVLHGRKITVFIYKKEVTL